jgi:biotin carboxyl carrier protein
VALAGETWLLERPSPTTRKRGLGGGSGQGGLEATMPGLVLDILVTAGEEVERGQTLLLLEAMKMELRISAPYAGRIARLCCAAGQVVERGQLLVEMEELC